MQVAKHVMTIVLTRGTLTRMWTVAAILCAVFALTVYFAEDKYSISMSHLPTAAYIAAFLGSLIQ